MMSKMDEVLGAINGKNRKRATKKAAAGLGTGLALGALAGLLFAPKPGRETREDIAMAAEKGAKVVKDKAEKGAQYVSDTAQDVAQMAKSKASTLKTKMKKGADTVANKAEKTGQHAEDTVSDIADDISEMSRTEVETAANYEDPHIETAEFNRPR